MKPELNPWVFLFLLCGAIFRLCSTFKLDSDEEWTIKNETFEVHNAMERFWGEMIGQEHVARLTSENFDSFLEENKDAFIMFYADWCRGSAEVKEDFARVALEMAYTEGFSQLKFAAIDCNATSANKHICAETFKVTKYPRFLLFRNSSFFRMYNVRCSRQSDFFYTWLVSRGDENFCSGAVRVASLSEKRSSNPFNLLFAIFTGYWRTVMA